MPWMVYKNPEVLGLPPVILSEHDPAPFKDQIEEGYAHGGGYNPHPHPDKWTLDLKGKHKATLTYTGDKPFELWASLKHPNGETLYVFDCAFVAIVQPSGEFEVVRMD